MGKPEFTMKAAIPILRMFDEVKAKSFYADFLEFNIDWEHRFEEGTPLYMQVSYDQCALHLSEHHGDGAPGAHIRMEVGDIAGLHAKLLAKKYKFARPGLETMPWNTQEVSVWDPFHNKITFYQNIGT